MILQTILGTTIIGLMLSVNPLQAESPTADLPEQTPCEYYKDIIKQYDWNDDVAIAVMMAESSCRPEVVNWKDKHATCMGSAGLFQVGCINAPIEEMQDPKQNIDKAYKLYQERGWKPWGAFNSGKYKEYL
jgi:hypothetical protein